MTHHQDAGREAITAAQAGGASTDLTGKLMEALNQAVNENLRLRAALNDAIRRPLGVVPASACEFYEPRDTETLTGTALIARALALGELVRLSHEMGLQ